MVGPGVIGSVGFEAATGASAMSACSSRTSIGASGVLGRTSIGTSAVAVPSLRISAGTMVDSCCSWTSVVPVSAS